MVLFVPLRGAARACLSAARPRASPGPGGASCGPAPPPAPCPPCSGAAPPACRARAPAVRRAVREVCCAPAQGARPPCAPRVPACSLSCRDCSPKYRELPSRSQTVQNTVSVCDHELDPVAKRLKFAKRARQAEYEREVAERTAQQCGPPRAAPICPYRLGGERECARATDGCMYAVPRAAAPAESRARCGPAREPPPPRCVELAPDDGCTIRGDARLDPCAHRPRVMIEIDRSANKPPCANVPPPPQTPPIGAKAKRAGDTSWCASLPPPAAAPVRCRRPTIVERLRSRSAPRLPNSPDERPLHTSAHVGSTKSTNSGLEAMLRSKENLKEAGLGRVVSSDCNKNEKKCPSGKLEMCVPPGTERVSVLVSLQGVTPSCPDACPRAGAAASDNASSVAYTSAKSSICTERQNDPCDKFKSTSKKRDSWLSIRSIQKKWTDCRHAEQPTVSKTSSSSKSNACPGKTRSPCASPAKPTKVGPCATPPGPCAKPASKSNPCRPTTPGKCGGSKNVNPPNKRCSSTSAFIASTIIANS